MPSRIVQPGDTLTQLAKGTGYTIDELAAYNRLSDPNQLRVGQDFFVPYSRQEFEADVGPMAWQPVSTTVNSPVVSQPVVQQPQAVPTSQAQAVDPDKVYTYRELKKIPGAIFEGTAAVKEVEKRLNRELSEGEKNLVSDEGFVTLPYEDVGNIAIGMGQQGKYYTPDNLMQGFLQAIEDKKTRMENKFGSSFPVDEKAQWALINLAYRGDVEKVDKKGKAVLTDWAEKFIAGDIKGAEKEFWNNNSYQELLKKEKQGKPTGLLNRLRRNAKDLFGFSSK